MDTILQVLQNNVGRAVSLQQSNGNHQSGYMIPFTVAETTKNGRISIKRVYPDCIRLINLKTEIMVHYGKSLFDMVDINEVEFTDIECIILGKRYGIKYIPLHTITEMEILP